MKKTYFKPSAKEVKLNLGTILAGSGNINSVTANPTENTDNMESKGTIWQWMDEEN